MMAPDMIPPDIAPPPRVARWLATLGAIEAGAMREPRDMPGASPRDMPGASPRDTDPPGVTSGPGNQGTALEITGAGHWGTDASPNGTPLALPPRPIDPIAGGIA